MRHFGRFLLVTLVLGDPVPGAHRARYGTGSRGLPDAPPHLATGRPAAATGSIIRDPGRGPDLDGGHPPGVPDRGPLRGHAAGPAAQSDRLEQTVLYRVPGYLLVRGGVGSFPGLSRDSRPEPALVETDEGWAFALLVERLPEGLCTVFLPDSPTPTTGSVRSASRIRGCAPRCPDAQPPGLPDPVGHRGREASCV